MSVNINIYRKMGPFVVVTVLSILIFLFMLAPLYSIDLNGKKTSISIYEQIEFMTSPHMDDFGHINNKEYSQLQYAKDRVEELDQFIKETSNDYDRGVLLTNKAFLLNDIRTYEASATLIAFNTLLLVFSFIGLLLFFVRRQRDRIIRFKFFAYIWLLIDFIVSCVITYSNNIFVSSIKEYGFQAQVGITQVASIIVLCFTLIIGAALFLFEISEIVRYKKNGSLRYVDYGEIDKSEQFENENEAIEPSNIE